MRTTALTMTKLFGEPISTYTREDAIDDGVLVDMNQDEFDEITKGLFTCPVAITSAVFGLMERAVENKEYGNDYKGIWHDMMTMARYYMKRDASQFLFKVIITGTGRTRNHIFKCVTGGGDNGEMVVTIMMRDED